MDNKPNNSVVLTLEGVSDLGYAEDHSFATFRLSTDPPSPLVEAKPFELSAALTKLQQLLRFLQQGLLDKGLGAPSASLIVEDYQVDPSPTARIVVAQLRPVGGDVTLKYHFDSEKLRMFAADLIAAADQVDRRAPPKAN